MPATVNVNKLTVVHAGSTGISTAFPDVCKTPTPAGPVPIPYPNVAQSSDTADGSSTVKVDGNPIMLKSSNFKMSTGDEAGSAMGVVSNKIKGKAMPMLYSMDVKVDGQNVFRLTDMMLQNCADNPNTPPASEVQGPLPEGTLTSKECEKVKEKRESQRPQEIVNKSGILPEHFDPIQSIAEEMNVIFYFRATDHLCHDWIRAKHQPKPHKIFKGNTIKEKPMDDGRLMTEWVQDWLNSYREQLEREVGSTTPGRMLLITAKISSDVTKGELLGSSLRYSYRASEFKGVVGGTGCGGGKVEPLKSISGGVRDSGRTYFNKWITGDYDLYQILRGVPGCEEVGQKGRTFKRIKAAINQKLKWDAIQHGPQAQWVATEEDVKLGAPKGVNFPSKMKDGFKNKNPKEIVPIQGRKPMKVFDDSVTIIAPKGAVHLESQQDTFDALICRECDK